MAIALLLLLLLPLAAACPTDGAAEEAEVAAVGTACSILGFVVRCVLRDGRAAYLCPHAGCGWAYRAARLLQSHLKGHDGLPCEVDGCDRFFTSKSRMKLHVEAHHRGVRVPCEVDGCDRSFMRRSRMKEHVEVHHRGVRVPCEVDGCDRSFTTRGYMKQHVEAHHRGVRVPCEVEGCDRSFTSRGYMKEHVEAHHRGVRFPCAHCGKSFATKRYMRTHTRRAHPNAEAGAGSGAAAEAATRRPAVSPVAPAARAEPTLPDLQPELNHPDATIPCPKAREGCPRVFRTKEEVRQHVAHPAMHIFRRWCPVHPNCGKTSMTGMGMRMHMVSVHGVDPADYYLLPRPWGPRRRHRGRARLVGPGQL